MKKLLLLLAFIITATQLFAQTQKVFLTKSGKFTTNASKAFGYLLIQKFDGSDGYLVTKYDIQNNLISKGSYKDEHLTVPSGKFIYYAKPKPDNVFQDTSYSADNKYYLASTGYYVDGKREGLWTEYAPNGEKTTECTYKNGILNGPYKAFSNNFYGEGTAVNGRVSGKFDWYTSGMLAAELYYDNGKLKSKSEYLKPASEINSLGHYLRNKLRKFSKTIYDSRLVVRYTVDKNGKISNCKIIEGYSPEINRTVSSAIESFNGFTPAKYNGKPIAQEYTQTFYLYSTQPYYDPYKPQAAVILQEMHDIPTPASPYFNGNMR